MENTEKYLPHPSRMDFLILSRGGVRPPAWLHSSCEHCEDSALVTTEDHFFHMCLQKLLSWFLEIKALASQLDQ